jgi:serine/threonine-protein kinase
MPDDSARPGPPFDPAGTEGSDDMTQACRPAPSGDAGIDGSGSGTLPVDEPTVISNRPPVHTTPPHTTLLPRELGQTLVGRKLAHFQLIEFVGGGGMGAVFRATDTMLNRTVAVKVLSRDQGRDEETVRRFQNEAQSAARLDHENIARVYFVGEDDGWYFIVFEFIEGRNLRELVGELGPLPVDQALQVTLQIAEALEHSAKREVVHRDIKPSNVLLTPEGKAKLVDMGLARLRPMHADEGDLTASGVTLGTFDYISPEQARDPRQADQRSDIYSLGCTLYFMLTGQPPFPQGTVLQKLLSHSSEPPPDPRQYRDDLPSELIPVLHKMLAKKPAERYQRPVDLISDLLLLADRLGIAAATRSEGIWATPATTRWQRAQWHLPWLLPTLALLLLAVVWDPTWLDGAVTQSIDPVYNVPARPIPTAVQPDDAAVSIPDDSGMVDPSSETDANDTVGLTPDASPSTFGPVTPPEEGSTGASSVARRAGGESRTGDPRRVREGSEATPLKKSSGDDVGRNAAVARTSTNPAVPPVSRPSGSLPSLARRLVVDDSPMLNLSENEMVVGDLEEACRIALKSEAVDSIEIRQSGRIEMEPLQLRLNDRTLRLVAGEGYAPILSFRTGMSVSEYETEAMIKVMGGKLQIERLHLEMLVPDDTLDGEWCLFQLEAGTSIEMNDSTVVIHNSYGGRYSTLDNVAVFNCPLPVRTGMLNPDMGEALEPIRIDVRNSVVRCEATVLRSREAVPVRFQWENGLLISNERLVSTEGRGAPPASGERLELKMKYVTAIVDKGLAELSCNASRPYLVPTSVESTESIWVTQELFPLVTQSGPRSLSEFMAQFEYQGSGSAYEGMKSFWKINPQDSGQAESFDFQMWRSHWNETSPQWERVRWRYAIDKNRPVHEQRVRDYVLSQSEAGAAGEDRSALGCKPTELPRLPEPDRTRPIKTRPLRPS